jgi:hypothetical protein
LIEAAGERWPYELEGARMRRLRLVALVACIAVLAHEAVPHAHPWDAEHAHALPPVAHAQVSDPSCTTVPMGALPGQPAPVWCYDPMETGPSTFRRGANTWEDGFDHRLNLADLGPGYRTFDVGSIGRTRHWRHADHWMVDIEGNAPGGPPPWDFGASMMRPDQTFRFINGMLVIEADVAAGVEEYQGVAWPELVVTTAAAPTQIRPNGTYVYEAFPNHWTVGCRLQADGAPTCALLDNTAGGDSTARVWEISHFQCGNTQGPFCTGKFGGHPSSVPNVHRFCRGTDPDVACRDRFRWEITKDRLTIFVNGVKYMEHSGFDPRIQIPDALLNADVYVYFGGFLFKTGRPVTRFHWDRIAINPASAGTPPVATATPTKTPTAPPATLTPTRPPATSTSVPSPTAQTVTFDDRAGQNRALDGQYPSGVIDWGTGRWYHAGPYGRFSTKSVSFSGRGTTEASFTFRTPRRLVQLDAHNGGTSPTTVSLACAGLPTKTVAVAAGQVATIPTDWSGTCTTVTVSSSNGWATNFDNLVHHAASAR